MSLYREFTDRAALERAYSPSSCVDDFRTIVSQYAARSAAARQSHPPATHAYGDHPDETLDVFTPEGGAAPALIYIHGGYWQELSKDDHSFPAPALNTAGIGYVAVNYGLAPAATLAEMIERCRQAVAWVAENAEKLGFDPDRLHLAGSSAGAHLAAMTALAAPPGQLASLTLLSGVFDLRPIPLTYINDAVGLSAAEAEALSPLLMLDSEPVNLPPTLVAVGEHETSEFKRQSAAFAAALADLGQKVSLRQITRRNHFDILFDIGVPTTELGVLMASLMAAATYSRSRE
ncbi:alpha/beta hydrolase [soil metagenome]